VVVIMVRRKRPACSIHSRGVGPVETPSEVLVTKGEIPGLGSDIRC